MNLSVCTISFRHQLISLDQIVQWASERMFNGIELWGVHAKNLGDFSHYNVKWMNDYGLKVSMISDYLPLDGDETFAIEKLNKLCELANFWSAKKVRTFAGNKASANVNTQEREQWVNRLRTLCEVAERQGIYLVVETHPNTLADTLSSTLSIIEEVNHKNLKINFDVIHVWEAYDDPKHALIKLSPYIEHMHLKNIMSRSFLDVFEPPNVYAPAGKRHGMVSVFDGVFNFDDFLNFVRQQHYIDSEHLDVSLEWFGHDVLNTLEHDCRLIQALPLKMSEEAGQYASSRNALTV